MTVRVRLAPSPTGSLHIGTARTAVFNWLFARNQGGQFILRIEDTDQERSRESHTQNILEGLTWLGLNWDAGPIFQSARLDFYRQMIQTLLDKGVAYRCYCTEAELTQMREEQMAKKQAPRYDNRHRNLTEKQRKAFEAEGRTSVIRFIIEDEREISWNDMVRGTVTWKGSDLGGDMVIARASTGTLVGQPLYNLAVVVDDIDMRITHVIRGEDHIGNTPKQILLYEAFGAKIPAFAHTPLILNPEGQKLSKRDGVTSISEFRQMGYTAEAMVNYMTLLGWSPQDTKELFTLQEAAQKFSFERVNKAGAKFDWDKLNWINSQYLHAMPAGTLVERLIPYWQEAGFEFEPVCDRPWLEQLAALIGPSLTRLSEAVEMSRVFFVPEVSCDKEAAAQLLLPEARAILEAIWANLSSDAPLTEASAGELIKKLTKEQNVKKGAVMRSLRAALTGVLAGPDLIQSWLLLHQRSLDRVRLQKALNINVDGGVVLSETPVPDKPKSEGAAGTPLVIAPSAGAAEPLPEVPAQPWQGTAEKVVDVLSNLPDYVTDFFGTYKKPIVSVGLIVAAAVTVRVMLAVLEVLNDIPLVKPTFELIGVVYAGWFIYRYLLSGPSRQELAQKVQGFRDYIAGETTSER
nr:glutamate--tRNA ligase [Oscillatoria sp. PCC 10802]